MTPFRYNPLFRMLPVIVLLWGLLAMAAPPEVTLASGGKAMLPIVVGANPSKRVRKSAETLANFLERISGAKFEIVAGDGQTGIAVGLFSDFPELKPGVEIESDNPMRREEYLIRTHGDGIYLIGATDLAVENAVWDLLYRLGYRHFFPGENWEIIPKNATPTIAVDSFEQPDYVFRKVWYGYGAWPENAKRTNLWRSRNRMQAAFNVNATHTYDSIIAAFPEEFAKHPEYLCYVNGKPTNKLNVSNPGLRKLVVQWNLDKMEKNPGLEVLPLDPSDGGGWGQSPEEVALGPISNRVVMLANEVAVAINARFSAEHGRKYVGMYAYNEHAEPPTIDVDPHVIVLVATAFNKSGLTLEQQIEGWRSKGASIGIRDYYNVITGSQDFPGKSQGANIERIRMNLPKYHKLGARFLSAESGDSWGCCGLGHYIASRLTWDIAEADRVPELLDDFFEKSFGPAQEPMKQFYRLLTPPTYISDSSIGSMYRALDEARKLTDDPGIRSRINDLLFYTRYVDLRIRYNAISHSKGTPVMPGFENKFQGFETLIRFLYRTRQSHMVHSKALWRDMPKRDKTLNSVIPKEARFDVGEGDAAGKRDDPMDNLSDSVLPDESRLYAYGGNPWKSTEPVTAAEIEEWFRDGIARNPVVDFEPVQFGRDLVPASPPGIGVHPRSEPSFYTRTNTFYTWVASGQAEIRLRATMTMKRDPQPGRILLQRTEQMVGSASGIDAGLADYVDDEAGDAEGTLVQQPVDAEDSAEIRVVEEPQEIVLKPRGTGLYRITLESRAKYGIRLEWDPAISLAHAVIPGEPLSILARFQRYFYVPKGTPCVAGYVERSGLIKDADGREVFSAKANGAHFSIPVKPGQDGRLWSVQGSYVSPALFTVPPYLLRSETDLLLPKAISE